MTRVLACCFFLLTVTGCTQLPGLFEGLGTLGGGAAGGALMHDVFDNTNAEQQAAATAMGSLAGGYFGSAAGKYWDHVDDDKYNAPIIDQTVQQALEYGQPNQQIAWGNGDTNSHGYILPGSYYENNGSYCRQFQVITYNSGEHTTQNLTGCRKPDGRWTY